MRAFIALDLPPDIKAELQAAQRALRLAAQTEVSWTKPENFHLTLKFFGELDESRVDEVIAATQRTAADFGSFELQLGATGVFPNLRQPRVLWIGLQGALPQLRLLQAQLDQQLNLVGFPPEGRGYNPHLTLGYLKSRRGEAELIAALQNYAVQPLVFMAQELKLIRSELHPSGARYTVLATLTLQVSYG